MPDSEPGEAVHDKQNKTEVPPAPPTPAITQPSESLAKPQPTPAVAPPESTTEVQGDIRKAKDREAPSARQMVWLTAIIAFATIVNAGIFYLESEATGKQIDKLSDKAGGIVGAMNSALSDSRTAITKAFEQNKAALDASTEQSGKALNASIDAGCAT